MNPNAPTTYAGIPDDGGVLLDLPELNFLKLIDMKEEGFFLIDSVRYYGKEVKGKKAFAVQYSVLCHACLCAWCMSQLLSIINHKKKNETDIYV